MGPLQGIRIIEIVGMGPAPYAAMVLADMGAEVIRVDRPGGGLFSYGNKLDVLNRNKKCICLNLKTPEGVEALKRLLTTADALIEGFRPGVMENFGLGPDECFKHNPKLIYGRATGWGQTGPLAQNAGHDLNYLALSGVLHAFGRAGEKPTVPLPLIGDFAGGALFLAIGVLSGLFAASKSGRGQVVDAAIVDGSAHMMSAIFAAQQIGFWSQDRGTNLLDGGAPFYDVYRCQDGKFLSVAAIETKFYANLLIGLGLTDAALPAQMDQSQWPLLRENFQRVIATRTRDEWVEIFSHLDTCVAPVLSTAEARQHPQHVARQTFVDDGDVWQPRPAPRFSHSDNSTIRPPVAIGNDTREVLQSLGYTAAQIESLMKAV